MTPATQVANWLRDVSEAALELNSARGCLMALACFANADGSNAYPAHTTIAAVAGLSVRDVQRKMKRLEQLGLIERTKAEPGRAIVYRINLPLIEQLADEGAREKTPRTSDTVSRPDAVSGTDRPRTDPRQTSDTVSDYQDQDKDHNNTTAVKGR